MMRIWSIQLVLAWSVTALAPAQATSVVVGPLGVTASATVVTPTGTTVDVRSLPAGTALPPPLVQLSANLMSCAMSSATIALPSGAGEPLAVTMSFQAYALSSPPATSCSAGAGADLVIDYRVPSSFAGWLNASASASLFTFGAQYAVDIGDDGTVELAQFVIGSATASFPVTFGPAGLRVRFSGSSGSAPPGRWAGSRMSVELVPRVSISPFGTPCGHALLGAWSGTPGADAIALRVVAAPASRFGLLGFGTQPAAVPITPAGCILSVDPVVLWPFVTDPSGSYTFVAALPPIQGLHLLVQSVLTDVSGAGFAETGNGLELQSR